MIIPGDNNKDWRWNKLLQYIHECPDEIGTMFNCYFKKGKKDSDFIIWTVFLYSTCYCLGSALYMAETLDYKTLSVSELRDFWKNNKKKLIFQSDRRYVKNLDWFVPIVSEFMRRTKRHPYQYIQQFITDDIEETYDNLYREIGSWQYFGRFSIILFLRTLIKVTSIRLDSNNYDWKNGATTVSGVWNAIYRDDRADEFDADNSKILFPKEIDELQEYLLKIKKDMKETYPEDNHTILSITSDLCSYRKLFKQTRYMGYYVDRQQEEIQTLQHNYPESSLWNRLWKCRKHVMPNELLGEQNGWLGIRKELCNSWVERGEFV